MGRGLVPRRRQERQRGRSKEAVNLIFDDDVWAILGSHDGRNAHLVEQVTAKTKIVFVSAWAADPTLSQAFVPWYFNCVPNNIQQAKILIKEIFNDRKVTKVLLVSDEGYDSKLAMESFIKVIAEKGMSVPEKIFYNESDTDFSYLSENIRKSEIECLVLFGQPSASTEIISKMLKKNISLPIYGALTLLNEENLRKSEIANYQDVIIPTSGEWFQSSGLDFRTNYQERYGRIPGAVAAYAYDGMNLLIESIIKVYPNRELIQKALSETDFKGVTGVIRFDSKGNRVISPGFLEIKNGIPVTAGK